MIGKKIKELGKYINIDNTNYSLILLIIILSGILWVVMPTDFEPVLVRFFNWINESLKNLPLN